MKKLLVLIILLCGCDQNVEQTTNAYWDGFACVLVANVVVIEPTIIPSTTSVGEIKLETPAIEESYVLTRKPGPTWLGPDGYCLMCLGNHLIGAHNIEYNYLMKIGYNQWQTLHDNLHNDKDFKSHTGGMAQVIGYDDGSGFDGYGRSRFRLFGRR